MNILSYILVLQMIFSCKSVLSHNNRDYRSYIEQYRKWPKRNQTLYTFTEAPNSYKVKLTVKVYYETLCPASVYFFRKQLGPVTKKLGNYLNIHLIPYGFAKTWRKQGQLMFRCQHGLGECYGNKVHACAIDELNNNTNAALFNSCLMENHLYFSYKQALDKCGTEFGITVQGIYKCSLGQRGKILLKHHGDDTHFITPSYIPFVILDGSVDNQNKILTNLLSVVCGKLKILPAACHTINSIA